MMENFKFYQNKYEIEIIAFVIMPNHFHMVCKCNELKNAIQSLKSYTAKQIIKNLEKDNNEDILYKLKETKSGYKTESDFQVWQEGYHPQQVKDLEILNQKIEYIHLNPVRKNLVDRPEDWKYSSAGFYLKGEDCGLEITPYY
jgi:REP element-mobilizing transposase RayT